MRGIRRIRMTDILNFLISIASFTRTLCVCVCECVCVCVFDEYDCGHFQSEVCVICGIA